MLGKVGAVFYQCHQGAGTGWPSGHWGLPGLSQGHRGMPRVAGCCSPLLGIGVRHFKGTEQLRGMLSHPSLLEPCQPKPGH